MYPLFFTKYSPKINHELPWILRSRSKFTRQIYVLFPYLCYVGSSISFKSPWTAGTKFYHSLTWHCAVHIEKWPSGCVWASCPNSRTKRQTGLHFGTAWSCWVSKDSPSGFARNPGIQFGQMPHVEQSDGSFFHTSEFRHSHQIKACGTPLESSCNLLNIFQDITALRCLY